MNFYYHKGLGLNMISFWKEILKFIPAVAVTCLFGAVYSYFMTVNGWLSLLVSVAAYVLVYVIAMWLLGLNSYEKQLIRKMLQKVTGGK